MQAQMMPCGSWRNKPARRELQWPCGVLSHFCVDFQVVSLGAWIIQSAREFPMGWMPTLTRRLERFSGNLPRMRGRVGADHAGFMEIRAKAWRPGGDGSSQRPRSRSLCR